MCRQSMQTKAMAPSRHRRRDIAERLARKAVNCRWLISPEAKANSRCLTAPEAADMAVDRHVVGRVGEHEIGALVVHQRGRSRSRRGHRRRAADGARAATGRRAG